MAVQFKLEGYEQTKPRKIFRRSEKKERFYIEFKPLADFKSKSLLYLWVESKYISTYCRHLTIFCPYLIINETKEQLRYQEVGLTSTVLSEDIALLKHEKTMKQKMRAGKTFKFENPASDYADQIEEDTEFLNKIHMFSTSKKMNKIQISLKDTKHWSKPFSLESADGVVDIIESARDHKDKQRAKPNKRFIGKFSDTISNVAMILQKKPKRESTNKRKKYEFSVRTQTAPGLFHRSKLIIFTPRFAIKNECDQFILLAQYDNDIVDENIVKIKQNTWEFFHWPDYKKPPHVVMSLSDALTLKPYSWSGRFKIDQVDEFVVKLRKEKNKGRSNDNFYYARVVINLDGTTVYIRILPEDTKNPPYRIDNLTTYEISYRQKPTNDSNDKKFLDLSYSKIPPGGRVPFTWDDMVINKLLEIEVEGITMAYSLDTIKDHDPILLSQPSDMFNDKSGRMTLKKGFLGRKKQYDDEYENE